MEIILPGIARRLLYFPLIVGCIEPIVKFGRERPLPVIQGGIDDGRQCYTQSVDAGCIPSKDDSVWCILQQIQCAENPAASTTCTAHARQGSNECTVCRISSGRSGCAICVFNSPSLHPLSEFIHRWWLMFTCFVFDSVDRSYMYETQGCARWIGFQWSAKSEGEPRSITI
jgi:hypothetical protein